MIKEKRKVKANIFPGLILLIILVNSAFASAITANIGNARMVLYPEVNGWTTTKIEKSILVKNVNDVPVNITLQVDETTPSSLLEVIDKEFQLQAGEEKKAEFLVKVKKEGTYEGRINVLFQPSEGKEASVALTSVILVVAKKDQDYQDTGDDNNDNGNDDLTGGVIGTDNKSNKGIILLGISTVLLALILVGLLYYNSKKHKNKKNKKETKRTKKSGRGEQLNETEEE